ncbi:FAD-dependent oxidoreductase [Serratia sp. UGAL515B_01]|uniref:FAD-dependent oxidoreductase n=1 Tax=Serratia sp. UGAL515B_01 TaxID=2986763 RepID=UPI0029529E7E|nr:FAD-dependent oxidoreductase [Serratia sp. UGAL515B_01]WON77726.1 FAD-dependent oxidoreductase [Serratia sp. UGAL515B_01]
MTSKFDILLVGAGHAHVVVLRKWATRTIKMRRIALLSPSPYAWYSGMLPGLLAGHYRPEQCRIHLPPICQAAGVEFIQGTLDMLDADRKKVRLTDDTWLQGEWLSLNTGSVPRLPERQQSSIDICPVKPFADFLAKVERWQQDPKPVAIVGGGAAGLELALALPHQVPSLALFCGGKLLRGHPPALRTRALRHLRQKRIQVDEHCAIDTIAGDRLMAGQRVVWQGNRVIMATGPAPLDWWQNSGLRCDQLGFIQSSETLQSPSHPHVFVTGDCAAITNTPKSGVYAVRQGEVLANNLTHLFTQQPLGHFKPVASALALLADGQGGALMSWGRLTAEGRWAGRWKDFLDRRFIKRHSFDELT